MAVLYFVQIVWILKKSEKEEFREAHAERKTYFPAATDAYLRLQSACGCSDHELDEEKV